MTMIRPMIEIGCSSDDVMSEVVGSDADPYSPPNTSPRIVVNARMNQSTSTNRNGLLLTVVAISDFDADRYAANAFGFVSRRTYAMRGAAGDSSRSAALGMTRVRDERNENARATTPRIAIAAAVQTTRLSSSTPVNPTKR